MVVVAVVVGHSELTIMEEEVMAVVAEVSRVEVVVEAVVEAEVVVEAMVGEG